MKPKPHILRQRCPAGAIFRAWSQIKFRFLRFVKQFERRIPVFFSHTGR